MKKALLTMGVLVAMTLALTSCGKKDCTCKATILGAEMPASYEFKDYDGDCGDINFDDMKDQYPTVTSGVLAENFKVSCEEM